MSSVVPLVPWHIAISSSPQSNNQQLECNEGELGELEVIWPITGGLNKTECRPDYWYDKSKKEGHILGFRTQTFNRMLINEGLKE